MASSPSSTTTHSSSSSRRYALSQWERDFILPLERKLPGSHCYYYYYYYYTTALSPQGSQLRLTRDHQCQLYLQGCTRSSIHKAVPEHTISSGGHSHAYTERFTQTTPSTSPQHNVILGHHTQAPNCSFTSDT